MGLSQVVSEELQKLSRVFESGFVELWWVVVKTRVAK